MKKITDKIEYDEIQVEAQGCDNDCPKYKYSNKKSNSESVIVGGSAITACVCTEKKEQNGADSNTWPLW